MVAKRGRGGRPTKGPRDAIMVRPHADLGALIREAAEHEDMHIGDYVAKILAKHHDRPDLAPKVRDDHAQEVLPLASSA